MNMRTNGFLPGHFDVVGRLKTSNSQNIFDADFEYGPQPLRWEQLTNNGGTILHLPRAGGCQLAVTSAAGSLAIRQSRAYHRYQPGKSMFMATAQQFGAAIANQVQRVGLFDDGNGAFFEQDGTGMWVVIRSDAGGAPVNLIRVAQADWNGDRAQSQAIDWNRIQMIWMEYAWYGSGTIRWGILRDGNPIVLHSYSHGNSPGNTVPWCRTGNLPTRYELRNTAASTAQSMGHYGVSVLIEGRADEQRGFTYSYGMSPSAPRRSVGATTTRFPVLSIRSRVMGAIVFSQTAGAVQAGATTTSMTVAGTPFTASALVGLHVHFPGLGAGAGLTGRITANTNNTVTYADLVTGEALASAPGAGQSYQIGLINRGQTTPRQIRVTSDQLVVMELISSIPGSPVSLTSPTWTTLATIGSPNSFTERDISATGSVTGGEIVDAFTISANTTETIDLMNLFPMVNTIRGNLPDVLTIAVTTGASAANVGAYFRAQESMS